MDVRKRFVLNDFLKVFMNLTGEQTSKWTTSKYSNIWLLTKILTWDWQIGLILIMRGHNLNKNFYQSLFKLFNYDGLYREGITHLDRHKVANEIILLEMLSETFHGHKISSRGLIIMDTNRIWEWLIFPIMLPGS